MKLRSELTKEEILEAIVEEFEKNKKEATAHINNRNEGRYEAMLDLLRKVKIYVEE